MSKGKVYVLQETLEAAEAVKATLASGGYEVVGCSDNGSKALAEIDILKPQLLITELMCYATDGIEVIRRLKGSGVKIIVLSAINREEIVQRAIFEGAAYFLVKPIDGNILVARTDDLFGEKLSVVEAETAVTRIDRSLDEKISRIFISVGIPPHIRGYSYLREGVKMAVKRPSVINNITKELYPGIGKIYSTSASKVERAIRHAIEVAWNRGRTDSINSVFGVRSYVSSEKPTNGEFIALVADKMILEGATVG